MLYNTQELILWEVDAMFPTRNRENGWLIISTAKVDITDTAQVIQLTEAQSYGAEILNAGDVTVYIDNALTGATTDSYELYAGERAWLGGAISAVCAAGETSVLKIALVK